MSIIRRRLGDNVYLYLSLTGKQLYLGTEDRVDPHKVNEALSYTEERIKVRHERDLRYYAKLKQMLQSLLPEEEHRRRQEIEPTKSKDEKTRQGETKRSRIVTLNLPEPYVEALDELIKVGVCANRAEAINIAVRDLVKEELWSNMKEKQRHSEKRKRSI